MAEYIIKDKVEWYKCKADITIGDKDFGNTGIVVIPVADISELPTIEIVHCGECKHYTAKEYLCEFMQNTEGDDWFCADGERKK